jgi:hypothetical protein
MSALPPKADILVIDVGKLLRVHVRVSLGGPTAAPDAPPASDNAPATPNTVTAFVRPFRFEFRLLCDMVESHFSPATNRVAGSPRPQGRGFDERG